MDRTTAAAEPVTADPPRPVGRAVLTQQLQDVTFLHWPTDPEQVAPLMPPGARPDVFDGATYVGLIALRMDRVGLPGLPGLPYFGSFPQTNVRVYSVGPDGRRGVVFCSLEAARLAPVTVGRAALRLSYRWAQMRIMRNGNSLTYTSCRRWPGPRGTRSRVAVRVGEPITEPSALEHWLTARWGLHAAWYGRRLFYLPNQHPRWRLHQARLVDLADDLIAATGLPAPAGEPVSVLYSPGVPLRAGPPEWLRDR